MSSLVCSAPAPKRSTSSSHLCLPVFESTIASLQVPLQAVTTCSPESHIFLRSPRGVRRSLSCFICYFSSSPDLLHLLLLLPILGFSTRSAKKKMPRDNVRLARA